MKIEFIKFKNYRQYREEQIDFTGVNDVTVIEGAMDSGKSSILNAITWCLYGEEIQLDKEKEGYPIINMITLRKMKPGDSARVEVEIRMKDNEGNQHIFIRYLDVRKESGEKGYYIIKNPDSKYTDGSMFTYLKTEKGRGEISLTPPEYFLEQIMPSNIKEYFFFDGDQLNLYFERSSGEKIKNAVFDISQITLLADVIDRLQDKKRELLKSIKDGGSAYEDVKGLLSSYEKTSKELKLSNKELLHKKQVFGKAEREVTQALLKCGYTDIESLEKESERLRIEIKALGEELVNLEKDKFDELIKSALPIICYDRILKTRNLIENADIPPPFKRDFIERLLKDRFCVCGTNLKKDKSAENELRKVLDKTSEVTNMQSDFIETKGELRGIIDELNTFIQNQTDYSKNIKKKSKEFDDKSKRVDEIKIKIGGIDKVKIQNLKNKQTEHLKEIEKLSTEIGEHTIKIAEAETKIKQYEGELEKVTKEKEKYKTISELVELLTHSIEEAERIRDGIIEEVRSKITNETKEQFFKIHWKKESYKDVNITDNYEISLLDPKGWETIGTISKGTRQVLAFSFLAALNSVSGFKAPIVIDTPLGRISGEPKLNIVKYLCKFLPGRQIIILMTDQEYTSEIRKELLSRLNHEYKIKIDQTSYGNEAKVIKYEK